MLKLSIRLYKNIFSLFHNDKIPSPQFERYLMQGEYRCIGIIWFQDIIQTNIVQIEKCFLEAIHRALIIVFIFVYISISI